MPRRCVFCGVVCQAWERFVCIACDRDLPRAKRRCPRCARTLPASTPTNLLCGDCQVRPPPFVATVAPLIYDYPVDEAIKALKFRRRLYYVPAFADFLISEIDRLPADIDALLPVPLHWRRQAIRGFNQAAELCRPVHEASGLPVLSNVHRIRATCPQSGLDAMERRQNLKQAFAVRGSIDARHVLIVDDVVTTEETCRQLTRTLLANDVEKVSVLAVARA